MSFFGKLAEVAGQYLKKGSQVYVEGRLQTRKWQDKDGQDRYTTEIRADEMKMLGGKPEGSGSRPAATSQPTAPTQNRQGAQPLQSDFEDDIPFTYIARGVAGHSI